MGHNLTTQKRGKGTSVYKSRGFRALGEIRHQEYSEQEKKDKITGTVKDIVHSPGHYAPIAKIVYGREEALTIAPFGLRVGEYRVILDIIKNKLIMLVLEVGHRKNIYK